VASIFDNQTCRAALNRLSPADDFHEMRLTTEITNRALLSADQETFYDDVVIPHLTEFVRRTLRTRNLTRREDFVTHLGSRLECGDTDIHQAERLLISGQSDLHIVFVPYSSGYLSAGSCIRDICDRTIVGDIHVNLSRINIDTADSRKSLLASYVHELVHVLGFKAHDMFKFFGPRNYYDNKIEDEARRNQNLAKLKFMYECQIDDITGQVRVVWDTPTMTDRTKIFLMNPLMIKAIDARGLLASDCRCPLDPNRIYTNEDIEHCIMHPSHCAVAVVSPKVVQAAREYFGSNSLEGMELETGVNQPECGAMVNSHWSYPIVGPEVMTATTDNSAHFLSPMTLALLEDSGWYQVDYQLTSTAILGATPKYQQGSSVDRFPSCDAVSAFRSFRVDDDIFCSQFGSWSCTSDSLTTRECGERMLLGSCLGWFRPPLTGNGLETDRCFVEHLSGLPIMKAVKCLADKTGYAIVDSVGSESGFMTPLCKSKGGITRSSNSSQVICADPAIVCAEWNHKVMDLKWKNLPLLTQAESRMIDSIPVKTTIDTREREQTDTTLDNKSSTVFVYQFCIYLPILLVFS